MGKELKSREGRGTEIVTGSGVLVSIYNKEYNLINESLEIINGLCKKYKADFEDIIGIIKEKERYIFLPVGVFRSNLSPLETIVRYLKDVIGLNFSKIASILNRDQTTIWTTYNTKEKKGKVIIDLELKDVKQKSRLKKSELFVPISIFQDRRLSVLEALCLFMKMKFSLNYHDIGQIIKRNERTVWTVVSRAKKKIGNEWQGIKTRN